MKISLNAKPKALFLWKNDQLVKILYIVDIQINPQKRFYQSWEFIHYRRKTTIAIF